MSAGVSERQLIEHSEDEAMQEHGIEENCEAGRLVARHELYQRQNHLKEEVCRLQTFFPVNKGYLLEN